jgi:hypothetical protein
MPTSLITKAVKDSSLVLFYYKDSTRNVHDASIRKVAIYHVGLMNISTTTTDHLDEHKMFMVYNESDSLGSYITFTTRWDGSDACYNPDIYYYYHPNPVKYAELPCKTKLYFRYIIIPAAKSERIMLTIDYNDYNAVMEYYHLADK